VFARGYTFSYSKEIQQGRFGGLVSERCSPNDCDPSALCGADEVVQVGVCRSNLAEENERS
jgi:hypothetical protein